MVMLAKVRTMALKGAGSYPVTVELDAANGLPCFITVGLPGSALKESRERVVSAVRNSGFKFPSRRVTVNLAPAQTRKEGTHFDLPIALAALAASGQVPAGPWCSTTCFVGELALDGRVRPVPGVLAMSLEARSRGFESMVVPHENAPEAAASGLKIKAVSSLLEAARYLGAEETGETGDAGTETALEKEFLDENATHAWGGDSSARAETLCLSDVKGQSVAKRALEVAAAGGHNILFIGPPGVGKSMLARRLPTLLPEPTEGEALEIAAIQSLVRPGKPARGFRPFRSPHHSASVAALVGGGVPAKPGEVTLAHGGVLFLDELAEFPRESLEALREPLEEHWITVSRLHDAARFPARFQLVAATNPCPCGWLGHAKRSCTCSPALVDRYLARLSGPLLDRIDIQLELAPIEFSEWSAPSGSTARGEPSAAVRARVGLARARQRERLAREDFALNAYVPHRDLLRVAGLDEEGLATVRAAGERLGLSARSLDRAVKVSRTIADLEGAGTVEARHVTEALQYRRLDRMVSRNGRN